MNWKYLLGLKSRGVNFSQKTKFGLELEIYELFSTAMQKSGQTTFRQTTDFNMLSIIFIYSCRYAIRMHVQIDGCT